MPRSPEGYVPEEARAASGKNPEVEKYENKIEELTQEAQDAEGEDLEVIQENIDLYKKLAAAAREADAQRAAELLKAIQEEDLIDESGVPISERTAQAMREGQLRDQLRDQLNRPRTEEIGESIAEELEKPDDERAA